LKESQKITDFSKFVPTILKYLYDEDLLSEEFLLKWDDDHIDGIKEHFLFSQERNKEFKIMSQPILEWLKSN